MTIASIIFTLGCLVGLSQLPRIWSHRSSFYDAPGGWWPYSEAAWRGWVRGLPAAVVGATLFGVAGIVGGFAGVLDNDAALTDTTSGTVVFVLGVLGFLLIVLSLLALYLNKPKWIVAPHLRKGRGLIYEWRRAREG